MDQLDQRYRPDAPANAGGISGFDRGCSALATLPQSVGSQTSSSVSLGRCTRSDFALGRHSGHSLVTIWANHRVRLLPVIVGRPG
jgi:hypothetical protein